MALFGKKNKLIEHPERFENEEHEIIALIQAGPSVVWTCGSECWQVSQKLLAWIDVETNELHSEPCSLVWNVPYHKDKSAKNKINLKKLRCCRLMVRRSLSFTQTSDENNPQARHQLFLTRIIKENCSDARLDSMAAEFILPATLKLPDGSVLEHDKDYDWITGDVNWLDQKINVILNADYDGEDSAELALEHFNKMNVAQSEWTEKIKVYAADELAENANDWQQAWYESEDKLPEITKEKFAERIKLCSITVEPNGDFTFYFDDDEMFWGHTVVVIGNTDGSFERADIWG